MHTAASTLPYRDRKRYAWLLSLLVPALTCAGPLFYTLSGDLRMLWVPVVLSYCVLPVLDWALGVDRSNPPEQAVPQLEADLFYRAITFALVPLLWVGFVAGVWFFTTHALPWHAQLAGVLSTGMVPATDYDNLDF